MKRHYAAVDGIRMFWVEQGEGVPVILLHGIPTSPGLWRKVIPRVASVRSCQTKAKASLPNAGSVYAGHELTHEGTPTKLLWFDRAPWKRIQVTGDEVVHRFPTPHADFLTQYIEYEVPLDKLGDLGRYDGSCLVDRTMGEAAARCDSEAANILTLNLMHEIVTGTRGVDDARAFYSETLAAYCLGESAPYCEQFQFEVKRGGLGDPDQPASPGPKARQATMKVEQFLSTSGRA